MKRVRFAPSPTGNLHIGTVRTALFNWLFCRKDKGVFILRMEDTDLNRSESVYEGNILEGMDWLGLDIDEGNGEGDCGPYRQSDRIKEGIYQRCCDQLIAAGHAYYCFATSEQLDQARKEAQKKGVPFLFESSFRDYSADQTQALLDEGTPYSVRLKVPKEGHLSFSDMIKGELSFDLSLIGDFVIMKSDGSPSYNFAVVVDDVGMQISHVIRGEDHISNTPKQLVVFDMLGAKAPSFAHMPMILGPDRAKLSKRHGATSITAYRDQGYLPEAFFNYLTLVGWSSSDGRELFSKDELLTLFEVDKVSKSNAIFDVAKLNWMNGQYIRQLELTDLLDRLKGFIREDYHKRLGEYSNEDQVAILATIRDQLVVLTDINGLLDFYFLPSDQVYEKVNAIDFSDQERDVLSAFQTQLSGLGEGISSEDIDTCLTHVMDSLSLGKGKVFKPVRMACSGERSGPDLYPFLALLGKDELVTRLGLIVGQQAVR